MGNTLIRLLEESIITKLALILLIFIPLGYLWITSKPVSTEHYAFGSLILGFFFREAVSRMNDRRKGK